MIHGENVGRRAHPEGVTDAFARAHVVQVHGWQRRCLVYEPQTEGRTRERGRESVSS